MHQYQVKQSKLRYSPLGAHTHCDSEQEWIVEYAKVLCQDLKNLHAFQWEVFRKKCRKGKIYFVQFLFLLKCSAVLRIPALILFNDCMYKIHCIHKFNKESDWKTLNKTKTTITEIKVIPKAKKQPDLPEKKKKKNKDRALQRSLAYLLTNWKVFLWVRYIHLQNKNQATQQLLKDMQSRKMSGQFGGHQPGAAMRFKCPQVSPL